MFGTLDTHELHLRDLTRGSDTVLATGVYDLARDTFGTTAEGAAVAYSVQEGAAPHGLYAKPIP